MTKQFQGTLSDNKIEDWSDSNFIRLDENVKRLTSKSNAKNENRERRDLNEFLKSYLI